MPSWDYCALFVRDQASGCFLLTYTVERAEVVPLRADATRGETADADAASRAIARLGDEGWELVSVVVEGGGGLRWTFKRPRTRGASTD